MARSAPGNCWPPFYPGGSARNEVKRRVTLRVETGDIESGATSAVMEELVAELVNKAEKLQLQLAAE